MERLLSRSSVRSARRARTVVWCRNFHSDVSVFQRSCRVEFGKSEGSFMKLRSLLIAATIISAPGLACAQPAQPLSGLYIGAGAGLNWLQDEHLGAPGGGAAAGNLASRPGFAGVVSLGYA